MPLLGFHVTFSMKSGLSRWQRPLKADLWRQAKLGEKPRHSWEQAATKWLKEREREGKKTPATDSPHGHRQSALG